jgi:hypothetical protein
MSRPQIQQYQPGMQTPGAVVNGGLIDFQDNTLRGVPDYTVTPSMLAAQQQQLLLQQQAGVAGLAQGHTQAVFVAAPSAGAVPPNWICGPASYYHVNGVTYAPVSGGAPVQVAPVAVVETNPPVSSGDAVEEDSGKRVRRQVQAYMTTKTHPDVASGSNPRRQKGQSSPEEEAAMRVNSLNASMPIVTNTNGHIRRKW